MDNRVLLVWIGLAVLANSVLCQTDTLPDTPITEGELATPLPSSTPAETPPAATPSETTTVRVIPVEQEAPAAAPTETEKTTAPAETEETAAVTVLTGAPPAVPAEKEAPVAAPAGSETTTAAPVETEAPSVVPAEKEAPVAAPAETETTAAAPAETEAPTTVAEEYVPTIVISKETVAVQPDKASTILPVVEETIIPKQGAGMAVQPTIIADVVVMTTQAAEEEPSTESPTTDSNVLTTLPSSTQEKPSTVDVVIIIDKLTTQSDKDDLTTADDEVSTVGDNVTAESFVVTKATEIAQTDGLNMTAAVMMVEEHTTATITSDLMTTFQMVAYTRKQPPKGLGVTTEPPLECYGTIYKILEDTWRHVSEDVSPLDHCDHHLDGWYGFKYLGLWAHIPDVYVKIDVCGSTMSQRLSSPLLDLADGQEQTSELCGSFTIRGVLDKCIVKEKIHVKKCDGFYIYKFKSFEKSRCPWTYCTILPSERLEDNGLLPTTTTPPPTTQEPLNIKTIPVYEISEEQTNGLVAMSWKLSYPYPYKHLDHAEFNIFIANFRKELQEALDSLAVEEQTTQSNDTDTEDTTSSEPVVSAAPPQDRVRRSPGNNDTSVNDVHIEGTPHVTDDGNLVMAFFVTDTSGNVIPADRLLAALDKLKAEGKLYSEVPAKGATYNGHEKGFPGPTTVNASSSERQSIWEAHLGLWIAVIVLLAVCLLIFFIGCLCLKCCVKATEEKSPLKMEEQHTGGVENPGLEPSIYREQAPMVEHENPSITANGDGAHLKRDEENWIVPMDELTDDEKHALAVENTKL